jgi:polyhydroxyalkanoate synthase
MTDESAFEVGRNLATTPGSVVYRNPLIELIQYAPTTSKVAKRPLLIVPPCINKYYILDLQPENSFVRYAVGEGHTVFMVSWRNIPSELGGLTWDDYLEQGVLAALDVACEITGGKTVNALGFCVGGTLLACALAVLAARRETPVASTTLLATMLDFADPGDIGVYVSREGLAARMPALCGGGRIQGSELASAFASLRPNELVWNYVVGNYLKGQTPPAFDLLYWNSDSANLPGPMYVEYLRNMYLDNRLREPGALSMCGQPIDLERITMPAYILATREDHIVPWRTAYKSVALLGGELTFVLGASGHIAGVINPAAKNRRNFWTHELLTDDPEDWLAGARTKPGSWWTHWAAWLNDYIGGLRAAPEAPGSDKHRPLFPAPGTYVIERVP